MRLINCRTSQLEEFAPKNVPPYAILSHMWGSVDEEIIYTDISGDNPSGGSSKLNERDIELRAKTGHFKIAKACREALKDGCAYLWVDTCCIDKRSSAELTEAINSMYNWYASAKCCYAYLQDVVIYKDGISVIGRAAQHDQNRPGSKIAITTDEYGQPLSLFYDPSPIESRTLPSVYVNEPLVGWSRWFTRGWTLQELLAPKSVLFFDQLWNYIGNRVDLSEVISRKTFIPTSVLLGTEEVSSRSIACRMSWAASRGTTRPEDIAYCLLGIFEVNMPLLYGEGGQRAYQRLQTEIMKQSADQSLFAWGPSSDDLFQSVEHCLEAIRIMDDGRKLPSVLATHPSAFADCADIVGIKESSGAFSMTNNGLLIDLPLATAAHSEDAALAVLSCGFERCYDVLIAIPLRRLNASDKHWGRYGSGAMSYPYEELTSTKQREIYISHREEIIESPGAIQYCSVELTTSAKAAVTIDNVYPTSAWNGERRSIDFARLATLDKHIYIHLSHWGEEYGQCDVLEEDAARAVVAVISLAPNRRSGSIQLRGNIGDQGMSDDMYAAMNDVAANLEASPRQRQRGRVNPTEPKPRTGRSSFATTEDQETVASHTNVKHQRPVPRLVITPASYDEDEQEADSHSSSLGDTIKQQPGIRATTFQSQSHRAPHRENQHKPTAEQQIRRDLLSKASQRPDISNTVNTVIPESGQQSEPPSNSLLAKTPSIDLADVCLSLRNGTVLRSILTCEQRLGQRILVISFDHFQLMNPPLKQDGLKQEFFIR